MTESGPDHNADREQAIDPARAAELLGRLRELPLGAAQSRILAVGQKIEEVLRGQIAAIKEQDPPWTADLKADWCDDQLNAIRGTLGEVKTQLPDELRAQFGEGVSADVGAMVNQRIDAAVESVLNRCTSILRTELPEAAERRADPHLERAEEEQRIAHLESSVSAASASANRAWLVAIVALTLAALAWCSR